VAGDARLPTSITELALSATCRPCLMPRWHRMSGIDIDVVMTLKEDVMEERMMYGRREVEAMPGREGCGVFDDRSI
jgi:hypothetical protein